MLQIHLLYSSPLTLYDVQDVEIGQAYVCFYASNTISLVLGEDSLIARGYNFRYSNNYFNSNHEYRQLIKAYGLLFIITVNAKAGAFNVIPTLQNVGSGLALLAVATIVCDIFVLYIHKKRSFFKEHKYEQVKNSDAYEVMDNRIENQE